MDYTPIYIEDDYSKDDDYELYGGGPSLSSDLNYALEIAARRQAEADRRSQLNNWGKDKEGE